MEIAFSLDEAARATFLHSIMQSFHSTYICLWSYSPHPSNCLLNLDGLYREDDNDDDQKNPPSSSLGSYERRLFNEYTQLIFNLQINNLVPGYAFKNNISFLEVRESALQSHASTHIQRQFYAAARIKSVVFMGSSNGEIEVGFSEVNMVENMKQRNNPLFPGWDIEQVSSMVVLQNSLLDRPPGLRSRGSSAFEEYNVNNYKMKVVADDGDRKRRAESMMKKWIGFYGKLKRMKVNNNGDEIIIIESRRAASAQLLHMIAERKRREKLNHSFLSLRSILPPQTKKDKASVLATTREYLTKLKAQVLELSHKNKMLLEAQVLHNRKFHQSTAATSSHHERFTVNVSYAPPGSTDGIIDLEITVRDEGPSMADIAILVLQFLKNIVNVRVVLSFHANHQTAPSPLTRLGFRFCLQGGEWDESAFLEAVRRIVSDLVPPS